MTHIILMKCKENRIIPMEIKAAENLKAKSLKAYFQKFNPEISSRTSLSDYRKEDWLVNLSLYGMRVLFEDDIIKN